MAIKSAFLSHWAYTPFHFSRTLPLRGWWASCEMQELSKGFLTLNVIKLSLLPRVQCIGSFSLFFQEFITFFIPRINIFINQRAKIKYTYLIQTFVYNSFQIMVFKGNNIFSLRGRFKPVSIKNYFTGTTGWIKFFYLRR